MLLITYVRANLGDTFIHTLVMPPSAKSGPKNSFMQRCQEHQTAQEDKKTKGREEGTGG